MYIDSVEKVQRKFTRILSYRFQIPYQPYTDRLNHFKMLSLADRRLIADEMLLYKLINNKLSSYTSNQINVHVATRFTRYTPTFYVPNANSNIEYYSVTNRIQRQHNHQFLSCNLYEQSQNAFRKQVLDAVYNPQ